MRKTVKQYQQATACGWDEKMCSCVFADINAFVCLRMSIALMCLVNHVCTLHKHWTFFFLSKSTQTLYLSLLLSLCLSPTRKHFAECCSAILFSLSINFNDILCVCLYARYTSLYVVYVACVVISKVNMSVSTKPHLNMNTWITESERERKSRGYSFFLFLFSFLWFHIEQQNNNK